MNLVGKSVLLTTGHKRIGSGGSMQLYLLARSLTSAGAKVQALFAEQPAQSIAQRNLQILKDLGLSLHFFKPSRWYSPFQIFKMRKLLAAGRFDIVHTHKGGDLSLVLLASTGMEIPVLVTTRGVNFPLGLNHFKYNFPKLDRVIVVSEDIKRVMTECGVREEKIRVIYGGVDTQRFSPMPEKRTIMRESLGLKGDATVCLVVANFVRQKGHGDYLKAAAMLSGKFPNLVHLFAGKGDTTAFQSEATKLKIADRVRFLGFRTDVEDILSAADFSAVSSFAGEGVSGVLRESMACGVPVITTDVGGNAELVRHEEFGLVTPMKDPAALAAAMERMITDHALRRKLQENGLKLVREHHSATARAKKTFALYEEILSGQ
jgi:glycosyltransferase involved in cell wall biosynthesis